MKQAIFLFVASLIFLSAGANKLLNSGFYDASAYLLLGTLCK